LEDKFNPNKDKISIIKPYLREQVSKRISDEYRKAFEENVKKYPNISFEEVVLRTYSATNIFYRDEYYVNLYNRLTKKSSSSPKQSSPKQSSPKQSSPKQSSPKQSSPKQSSPKQKSPPKPKSPKYLEIDLAFKDLFGK